MYNTTPSSPVFESLQSRYIGGAFVLFFSCVLFAWMTYSNVSDRLESVTSNSKYQLQLSSGLNEFTESFYNIEKLLQYYPQLSNEVIYKQLQDNLSRAEAALKKIEYGHWVVDKKQQKTIIELRSYVSTYRLHVNGLFGSSALALESSAISKQDIDAMIINLRPIVNDIWGSLKKLEDELQTLSVIEMSGMAEVQDGVALMLLFGLVLAIGFLLVNFLAIKKWVLEPLLSLSKGIVDKNDFKIDVSTNASEIKTLVEAIESRCAKNEAREKDLEYQVLHDPLTGLPNRIKLRSDLQSAINDADVSGQCFTLLMIDLDRFKEINDTLGHHVGDRVLCEISDRFSAVLASEDIIARLGGDEFAVLLVDSDVEKAREAAQKLLRCFRKDLFLDGHHFNIGGSIGMAVYPWHAMNEQELLQRADVAMYFAKRKNFGYAIYDKSEDKHDIRQLGFEVELRDAIDNDDLSLHYQPKIGVDNRQVVSAEVLLRWNHAEHGYIPAEEISLLAEKTGLITPLSKWVVKNAIEQLAGWIEKGIELPLSINLSVWNLQDPEFFSYIKSILKETRVPADMITLEITESAVMSDPESALKTLRQLSSLGTNLSIDDYGTGFSSLQYLKILPIDEIKIDKSFVTDMVNYDNDAVIVRSIIDLSHNLGLKVVAEGVETQEVYDILEILRCDVIQGYHISRPVPSNKLEEWLCMRKNDSIMSKANNITYLYN